MKIFTILSIILFCFSTSFAQVEWEWSSPKALSDSSSDNQHVTFLSQGENATVVWDKVINENTTALCMKSIRTENDPEHILLQDEGIKYTNPTGYEDEFNSLAPKFVVFQTHDVINKIKLQYILVYPDSVSDPQDIAEQSFDQVEPKMKDIYLFWISDSTIYASCFYNNTFSSPARISARGAYSVNASAYGNCTYLMLADQKSLKISKQSYCNSEGIWSIILIDSIAYNEILTHLDIDSFNTNMWCTKVVSGPNTGSLLQSDWFELVYYHTNFDLVEPTIDHYVMLVDGKFYSFNFLAFASDSLGNYEVFAHHPEMNDFTNISQHDGNDRNPEFFSMFSSFEGQGAIWLYLVWESERQGNKTLYYSTLIYRLWGANKKLDSGINIKISPNPLSTQTTISFPIMQNPVVKICSMYGKEICNLRDFTFVNSNQLAVWDGKDNSGRTVPAGNYLVIVQGDKGMDSKVIVKQ